MLNIFALFTSVERENLIDVVLWVFWDRLDVVARGSKLPICQQSPLQVKGLCFVLLRPCSRMRIRPSIRLKFQLWMWGLTNDPRQRTTGRADFWCWMFTSPSGSPWRSGEAYSIWVTLYHVGKAQDCFVVPSGALYSAQREVMITYTILSCCQCNQAGLFLDQGSRQ
jgi:hypothetical protein